MTKKVCKIPSLVKSIDKYFQAIFILVAKIYGFHLTCFRKQIEIAKPVECSKWFTSYNKVKTTVQSFVSTFSKVSNLYFISDDAVLTFNYFIIYFDKTISISVIVYQVKHFFPLWFSTVKIYTYVHIFPQLFFNWYIILNY